MEKTILKSRYDDNIGASVRLMQRDKSSYISVAAPNKDFFVPDAIKCFELPVSYHIRVTNKCNLSCSYCYAADDSNKSDLSKQQFLEIIDICDNSGGFLITWTGGEPLLFEGVLELFQNAHKRGLQQILLTNATLLDDYNLSNIPKERFIIQAGLNEIWSEKKEDIENCKITIDRVSSAIKKGHSALVSIVLDPDYIDKLPKILLMLENKSILNVKIGLAIPVGRLAGMEYRSYLDKVQQVRDTILKTRVSFSRMNIQYQYDSQEFVRSVLPKRFTLCEAGISQIYIDNNGDVYPCPLLKSYSEFMCGNIMESSVKDIWNSKEMDILRNVSFDKCNTCNQNCGTWCRALNYSLTKDISSLCICGKGCEYGRVSL